ncbi:MAG: hypothetical protein M1821_003797 [Bathelium mastoideum]|nr:MAG: hypothetical protein M1821_003797 [Bathelium mastoideum]
MKSSSSYHIFIVLVAGLLDTLSALGLNQTTLNSNQTTCFHNTASNTPHGLAKRTNYTVRTIDQCPPQECVEWEGSIPSSATLFLGSWRDDGSREGIPDTDRRVTGPRDWKILCWVPDPDDPAKTLSDQYHKAYGNCNEDEICFNNQHERKALCVAGMISKELLPTETRTAVRRTRIYPPDRNKRYAYVEIVLTQRRRAQERRDLTGFYEAKYIILEAEHHTGKIVEPPELRHNTNSIQMYFEPPESGFYIDVAVGMQSSGDEAILKAYFE